MLVRRVLAGALAAGVVLLSAAAAQASRPLRTGIFDPAAFGTADPSLAFARTKAAGASFVRLAFSWAGVAQAQPASAADAENPGFAGYHWTGIDNQVEHAAAAGLTPVLDMLGAPSWAQPGGNKGTPVLPDVEQLGEFAKAVALHFGGSTPGVPRVRFFQLWNEPNLSTELEPQTAAAAVWYRNALNAFAASVHGVHSDNLVVAGGLAPFEELPRPGVSTTGLGPIPFIRIALCMSAGAVPKPTCKSGVDADIWAFHPYTYGQPTDKAASPNELSAGDIPRAEALLRAAQKAGHLRSRGPLQFWVTEFSYDTNPPDSKAIPIALQARWTSEALFEFWSDGIDLVTWFLLRDMPYPSTSFQSGLYFAGASLQDDKPKPTLTAFRFPFVAVMDGGAYTLWGRTPDSKPAAVTIELKSGPAWTKLLTLHADANGIFQTRWSTPLRRGFVRARLAGGNDVSLSYGLRPAPDLRVLPFGH